MLEKSGKDEENRDRKQLRLIVRNTDFRGNGKIVLLGVFSLPFLPLRADGKIFAIGIPASVPINIKPIPQIFSGKFLVPIEFRRPAGYLAVASERDLIKRTPTACRGIPDCSTIIYNTPSRFDRTALDLMDINFELLKARQLNGETR